MRDKAFDKLQKVIEEKLYSQYRSYVGLIGSLKLKSTREWIESEAGTRVAFMEERFEKLLLQLQHWKQGYDRQTVRESELIRENIHLKNKVATLEKHAGSEDQETSGGTCTGELDNA